MIYIFIGISLSDSKKANCSNKVLHEFEIFFMRFKHILICNIPLQDSYIYCYCVVFEINNVSMLQNKQTLYWNSLHVP